MIVSELLPMCAVTTCRPRLCSGFVPIPIGTRLDIGDLADKIGDLAASVGDSDATIGDSEATRGDSGATIADPGAPSWLAAGKISERYIPDFT